jgi:hypothetical protein
MGRARKAVRSDIRGVEGLVTVKQIRCIVHSAQFEEERRRDVVVIVLLCSQGSLRSVCF